MGTDNGGSKPPYLRNDGHAFATRAVRDGGGDSTGREHSQAPALSSSFVFDSAEEAAKVFAGELPGYVYSRYSNPTVQTFEARMASLEGADFCLATASGMASLLGLCLTALQPGDRVVSSNLLFGTTHTFLQSYLPRLGCSCDFVPMTDYDAWRQALRADGKPARLAILETPANPCLQIVDLPRVAQICAEAGTELAVDNTFCTAAQLQPLSMGATWCFLSATKWLDGQGRCIGGVLLGPAEYEEAARTFMRVCGPTLSAFDAWVFLKGLETLDVRLQRSTASAAVVADWLCRQKSVERVYYPGLRDHPGHELAAEQMAGFGAVVSFSVAGGQQAAWRCMDSARMLSITPNLGDTRSTLTHPWTTTHRSLSPEQKTQAEIVPGLVRLSVGLEDPMDICNDLQSGLDT